MKKTNTSRDRWTRFLSALLCFVMILGVIVTPKASAAAPTLQLGEAYYIKETTTGRYLTVNGGKDYNFNPVGVNPLVSAPSQRWVVRASSYGGYQLFPECSTTRILDVSSGQTDIYLNKGCKNYNSFFITGNPFTGCQISNQGKYLYAESGKANKWSYVKVSSTTSSTWIFEPVNPVAAAPNEYTVTFYVDGEAYDTQTVEENCTADVVEEPYLNGCYFEGWFEEGAEDPYDFSPVTESIDLYAKFTVPVNVFYTICGAYESDTLFFPYGECINEEDLPLELENRMVSGGWFLDTSFTNKFDFTQPLAEPTDLFLKPELKTHVIGYFVNGNLDSMEFVLDQSMANLPSKINGAPVVWYLDEEMTTPYSACPVTDSFNLYTHVLAETDEYQIFDAETQKMLVYNRSLCRTE